MIKRLCYPIVLMMAFALVVGVFLSTSKDNHLSSSHINVDEEVALVDSPAQTEALPQTSQVLFINPENIEWKDAAPLLPGAHTALIFGNPKLPGTYTMRLKLPANFQVPPHKHSQDEYFTIISGSLNAGIGSVFDKAKTKFMPTGAAVYIPANVPHYVWTTEEVVMQIRAVGPRDTIFVNSEEEDAD